MSRVAARDSSRTLATVQDVFTALGEDDTIYTMFKSMKGDLPLFFPVTASRSSLGLRRQSQRMLINQPSHSRTPRNSVRAYRGIVEGTGTAPAEKQVLFEEH